ncbi:MAG: nickel superoxide dismutase [Parvibaculaceae bacterium]|jgi:nickel superoxide dismutase
MLHKILKSTDALFRLPSAQAHCDVPCKVYDPAPALIAALSVIRMADIMAEAEAKDSSALEKANTLTRCVMTKEEEAEKVKHEVRVIWGDYFKAPQLEEYPQVHDLVHQIMMKGSACKQTANRENGEALLELVNQFAEIFWATKGVKTTRKTSPYPPSALVVCPEL